MSDPENIRRGRANKRRGGYTDEVWFAELIGGERIKAGVGYGDVQTTTDIWEAKSHQRPPPKNWLRAEEQARKAAAITGKDPRQVHIYREGGKRVAFEIRRIE